MKNGGENTTKQITAKQHFAPSFYLKRFADNNLLETIDLKKGRIIKSQSYSSVCYERFFYAVETGKQDDISQEFEEYLKSIEDMFAVRYDSIADTVINYQQLTDEQLEALSLFIACLWLRGPLMRKQINQMCEQIMKVAVAEIASCPSFGEGAIEGLAKEGHIVTEDDIRQVKQAFINQDYGFELTNGIHLNVVAKCVKYSKWLLAKNWRFYLAKSTKQFITSDTPVIEIYDKENRLLGNHIVQRQHFFAFTPRILIELTNPLQSSKKVKREVVSDAAIEQYNLLRAKHSQDYCYAHSKSDLEDLLPYYTGGLIVKQAVARYLQGNKNRSCSPFDSM